MNTCSECPTALLSEDGKTCSARCRKRRKVRLDAEATVRRDAAILTLLGMAVVHIGSGGDPRLGTPEGLAGEVARIFGEDRSRAAITAADDLAVTMLENRLALAEQAAATAPAVEPTRNVGLYL